QRASEEQDGRPSVLGQHEVEDPALPGGDGCLVEDDEAHGPPRLPERRKAEGGAEIGGADGVVPSLDQLRAQQRAGPLVRQDEEDDGRKAQSSSTRNFAVMVSDRSQVTRPAERATLIGRNRRRSPPAIRITSRPSRTIRCRSSGVSPMVLYAVGTRLPSVSKTAYPICPQPPFLRTASTTLAFSAGSFDSGRSLPLSGSVPTAPMP